MAKAQKEGWVLVALDCDVDTSTPAGEAMAHMLATFSQFERRLIGQRTREALAVGPEGVRLGRPPRSTPRYSLGSPLIGRQARRCKRSPTA